MERWRLQTLDLSNPAIAPAGATGFNLVLAPHVLIPGENYTFRLEVVTTEPEGVGQGEVTVQANKVRGR